MFVLLPLTYVVCVWTLGPTWLVTTYVHAHSHFGSSGLGFVNRVLEPKRSGFFTVCIQNERERYCFHRCLSVHTWGVPLWQYGGGGIPHPLRGGACTPIQLMGVPPSCQWGRGYLGQVRMGYPPRSRLHGVPPQPSGLDGGSTPETEQHSEYLLCGGRAVCLLRLRRRTFLLVAR